MDIVLITTVILLLTLGVIFVLLTRVKVCFRIWLRVGFCNIKIKIGILPTVKLHVAYKKNAGVCIWLVKRNGYWKPIGRSKRSTKQNRMPLANILALARECILTKKLQINGEIGVESDPCTSVMLAGIANTLLSAALPLAIVVMNDESVAIFISPCMGRSSFAINATGILRVNVGKLIYRTAVIKLHKAQKEDNNVTPNRKPYAVISDADQGACGC